MKHRDCRSRATNGPPHSALNTSQASRGNAAFTPRRAMGNPTVRVPNGIWTGNVADENNCGGNPDHGYPCAVGSPSTWSEADSDYYVPYLYNPGECSPACAASFWVGLGGTGQVNGTGPNQLVQAGIEGDMNSGTPSIYPWVECQGNPVASNPVGVGVTGIWIGTHVYTRIYPTSFEIGNIDTQQFGTWSTDSTHCPPNGGATATENSAEFIVEANGGTDGLTEFSNFFWYGVGVTDQYGYHPMDGAVHDYAIAYWQFIQQPADQLMNIGEIQSDPGDYPYDEYETSWIESCPGSCA